jgi:hypothetical protein
MPKTIRDFPDRLEFQVPHDMKVSLIALAFLTGHGHQYSTMARNLLHQAIESAVEKLEPKRREAFDDILANVKISYPPPGVDIIHTIKKPRST